MDQISETASLCSNSSLSSSGNIENIDRIPNFYLINPNDSILNNRYESIVSKQLTNFPQNNFKKSLVHYKRFLYSIQKFEQSKQEKELLFKIENVGLTETDRYYEKENEDLIMDDNENISKQFEMTFGTTINDYMPEDTKPYLEFDLPPDQQRERLNEWQIKHSSKDIKFKCTIAEDIEQQERLKPFRVSRRQRKKLMAIEKKKTLANWFDISRVEELTKDQEKDLLALKMRRVWNPKQFYKRSSGQNSSSDHKDQYFEIGTIQENPSDFYGGRLVRRERKQTMLDELMADAQLQAFNKRKVNSVISKNSRIKRLQARKFKRKLRKQKEEKANRFERMRPSPHQRANIFKTFEL